MLSFEEALTRILALGAPVLATEHAALEESDGRVLGEDLVASVDLPRFDYSAMDGYALRAADLAGVPPFRIPVRGESRTGSVPGPLTTGSAMRIFTGAAMPDGADSIVMQENVARDGDVAVLTARPSPGPFVRRRGEDLAAGGVAIPKGTRLRPAHLALAASIDASELRVVRRPEVAILATGDELRRPGTDPVPGTIPDSNTTMLRAMVRRAGASARALPFVRDERVATERAFAAALESSDVVVTIGGVSVGDHDLVRPALEAVGVKIDFWRVAMKPGKPLAVGTFARSSQRDALVLGLPGNPASAMVTFALFGIPLLRALQGEPRPFPPLRRARITRPYVHDPGRLEFVRALVTTNQGELSVTPFGNQASGAHTSLAGANALALVPLESTGVPTGAEVDVLLLDDLCG